jgi:Flp pilus assembly protein CpaB
LSTTTAPRRRARTIQVIIGVLLVVVAFVGVLIFSTLIGKTGKTTVVGAAHDIKTQTVLTDGDLTTVTVDALPTGAIKDKASAVGKFARSDLKSGAPVLDSDLAAPASATPAKLYFALPAGKVALNIPAGEISPYVQPGDQIDILASPKPTSNQQGSAPTVSQTKATLKGLRVLAVGAPPTGNQQSNGSNNSGGNANPSGGNLVVQVSLQDAETLEFIIKNTDFTYVLKSPLDVNAPDPSTTGVDLNSFKAAYGYK